MSASMNSRQFRHTLRNFADLSTIFPSEATSPDTRPSSGGTAVDPETSDVPTATVPATNATALNSSGVLPLDKVPEWVFSIVGAQCCGLMEVSGLTRCGLSAEHILVNLHRSMRKQNQLYNDWLAGSITKNSRMNELKQAALKRALTAEERSFLVNTAYDNGRQNSLFTKIVLSGAFIFTLVEVYYDTKDIYDRLAKYIHDNNLGTFTIVPPFFNMNSGNRVVTAIYCPNWEVYFRLMRRYFPDASRSAQL